MVERPWGAAFSASVELLPLPSSLHFLGLCVAALTCPAANATTTSCGQGVRRPPRRVAAVGESAAERPAGQAQPYAEYVGALALTGYVKHYNECRPHRVLDLRPPCPPATVIDPAEQRRICRRPILGGLINEHVRAA
jgi:hypothetical protein